MSFLNTGCGVIPDHIEQTCNKFRKGGIPSVAIVQKAATVVGDWANATKWLADIAAGNIKVINRVKFSLPNPSPIKTDNPVACGAQQILDGFDWKLTGTDGNANSFNDSFYTALNGQDTYFVMWNHDEAEIVVIDKPVVYTAMPMIPDSNRAHQAYTIEGEWVSAPNWFPTRYTAPTGVFAEP